MIGGRGWHTDPIRCITRVRNIFPIGPAAESGGRLRPGDVILCVNGHVTKHLTNAVSIRIGIRIHLFCPSSGDLSRVECTDIDIK